MSVGMICSRCKRQPVPDHFPAELELCFGCRLADVKAAEAEFELEPSSWLLVFAGDKGFLGACVVVACGATGAVERSHELGINPGGAIAVRNLPDFPEFTLLPHDRLLSESELP